MKRYKHKQTGYIATETQSESNYKVSEPRNFTIPKWIVECSNEWEIQEEALFITEDGHGAIDGYRVYQVSIVSNYSISNTYARKEILPIPSYFKYFLLKTNAENYADLHKTRFSLKDIEEAYTAPHGSPLFESLIDNLKKLGK